MTKHQPHASGRKPTHRLYSVQGDGEDANWTPIGAAWLHRDGKGFNIHCDTIPLQGRLVLRLTTLSGSTRHAAGAELPSP